MDADEVCYGGPLLVVGLTRMAQMNIGVGTDYVGYSMECVCAGAGAERRAASDLYTAMFCVTFMGELGQAFNTVEATAVDPSDVERLARVLDQLLGSGGGG